MLHRLFKSLLLLMLFSLLAMVSCGPSAEDKARKIALRDSTSFDSAMKKEDSIHRIYQHHNRHYKDSILKSKRDSIHSTDSVNMVLFKHKDSLKNVNPRLRRDSILRRHKRDSILRKFRSDTNHYHKTIKAKKINDSMSKKNTPKPKTGFDTSTNVN